MGDIAAPEDSTCKIRSISVMADTKEMNPVIAAAIGAEPEEKDCVCWVKA